MYCSTWLTAVTSIQNKSTFTNRLAQVHVIPIPTSILAYLIRQNIAFSFSTILKIHIIVTWLIVCVCVCFNFTDHRWIHFHVVETETWATCTVEPPNWNTLKVEQCGFQPKLFLKSGKTWFKSLECVTSHATLANAWVISKMESVMITTERDRSSCSLQYEEYSCYKTSSFPAYKAFKQHRVSVSLEEHFAFPSKYYASLTVH